MKQSLAVCIAAVAVGLFSREARASGPVTLQQGAQFSNNPTEWCVNPRARPPGPPDDLTKDRHTLVFETDADENPVSSSGEGGYIDGSFDLGRGSKLVTVSMGWIGTGVEHLSPTGALSNPRRSPFGLPPPPRTGEIPALTIRRFHDPRHPSYPSSFGPGVFSGYDLSLTLARANAVPGSGSVVLYDPRDVALRPLDYDPATKTYLDRFYCSVDGLSLRDAGDQPTEDQAAAVTAVLTARNGWKFTFEIIRTAANVASTQRFGRLVREEDRNENKVEIAYQLPADASDAQLGVDRSKLWKVASVTDAYGRVATFTYHAAKKDGRWVVSSIQVPNGSSYLYNYKENNQIGLTSVVFPDGRKATFSAFPDPATQTTVLRSYDPTSPGARLRQDVYLTNATWVNPNPTPKFPLPLYNQTPNLVRMVVDGKGDVIYLNRSEFDPVTGNMTYYVYGGGHSFFRYRTTAWGSVIDVEQIVDWDLGPDPANLDFSTFTYRRRMAHAIESTCHRVTSKTDILGRKVTDLRDAQTGALLSSTYPDGSVALVSYTPNRRPLKVTDRIGRTTKNILDAEENLLTQELPGGATLNATYNVRGQPITSTDGNGNTTSYLYEGAGYLASVTEPLDVPPNVPPGAPPVHTYEHGIGGRLTKTHEPGGRVTSYSYDGEDRITLVHYHDLTEEHHTFGTGPNDGGRPLLDTDRLGSKTHHEYDANGLEQIRTEAFGAPEHVARVCDYLKGTSLAEVCTDRGERTTYTYDDYNVEISVTRQVGTQNAHPRTTSYDHGRRVLFTTDPYERRTYYAYDRNDRKMREIQEMTKGAVPPPPVPPPNAPFSYNYPLLLLPRVDGANAPQIIHDFAYDAAGQLIRETDGRGIVWAYDYDTRGHKIREIENASPPGAEHAITEYAYDVQGNRTQIRHPRFFSEGVKATTDYTYTARNLLHTLTLAKGGAEEATETYAYDVDQRMSTRTDALGAVWSTVWSQETGLQTATFDPPADVDGDASTPDTRAVHAAVRDSLGHVTHEFVTSDALALTGFPVLDDASFEQPSGTLHEITTRYDALYRPVARTVWLASPGVVNRNSPPIAGDANHPASDGLTTRWIYDDDLSDALGLSLTYSAQLAGLDFGPGSDGSAVEEENPAGEKSVTVRDGVGRVIATINGLGLATKISYDQPFSPPVGVPAACPLVMAWPTGDHALIATATTDPMGNQTRIFSDGAGRKVGTEDAEGNISVSGLDAVCNIVCERDPNGVGLDHAHDRLNREFARTDTLGDTVLFAYDKGDNEVLRTDAAGNSSSMSYDARNRKIDFTDRKGATTHHVYDKNGNLTSRTDGETKVTSYEYDARDLKTKEIYMGGSARTFTYDAAKRPLGLVNEAGQSTVYTHDRADRLIKRAHPGVPNDTDTFVYDDAGRVTSASSPHYSTLVQRSWDAAGRMSGETLTVAGQSYLIEHAYDAANRATGLTYPDGAAMIRGLTARGLIDTVSFEGEPVALFGYDAGKRRISTDLGNGRVEARSYRADDRIQSIAVQGVTDFTYTYSENKLPLTQANVVSPVDGQAYTYDENDRLVTFSRSNGDAQSWALSPMGDWTQVTINGVSEIRHHDDRHQLDQRDNTPLLYAAGRGNLTSEGAASSYVWDVENRLESAVVGNTQVEYAYDALGRRVRKTVGLDTTIFVYDGWRAIAEYADGADPSSPLRRFVFGDALDELLMMTSGAERYYYHGNNLSTVYALTNQSGTIVEGYRYDPYGKVLVLGGPGVDQAWFTADDVIAPASPHQNPYMYTGQRADDETGLFYYKNRYYSPALGRFLSRDPKHYDDDMAYVYVGDEPIATADPEGTEDVHGCGRCCLFESTNDWNVLAVVDPGLAPTIATGLALQLYGRLRDGTWTAGSYKLASETYLKPDVAYAYYRTPDASIGTPVTALLVFQTSFDTIPGSYQVVVPIYSQ